MKKNCVSWTPEMESTLSRLYNKEPLARIAQILGVSLHNVYAKVYKTGLRNPPSLILSQKNTIQLSTSSPEMVETTHGTLVAQGNSRVHTMR